MPRKRKTKKPDRAIHAQIAKLRKERNLSQRELADLCDVDETAVSHWETGLSSPKGSRLPAVAAALNVSIDELFREAS